MRWYTTQPLRVTGDDAFPWCGRCARFTFVANACTMLRQATESAMTAREIVVGRARASTSGPQLGTFAGVFTPSILTILGIILFLRLGYVVGAAGLERALWVIAAANAISVLTALSVSAISTNLRVKGGGDYYLISRTLGLSFGGAIGVVVYFAQAVSIGFYCIGFAEAVAALAPLQSPLALHGVAALAVIALGVLAWLGADLATRFQYFVMGALVAGLLSFGVGALDHWSEAALHANWAPPPDALSFWAAFAIFFPAVTGFTQGVSMSGDLAKPGQSIPRGVLSAVGLSVAIYFGCAVLFAASLSSDILRGEFTAMKRVAGIPLLIDIGVMAATLSSALASFLGAPRILQSLAKDEVFPLLAPFARGGGGSTNPRRAVIPTLAIALAIVGIGNLNLVAAVVSMFFLVSYGLLNYATYYEARAASPSFRPTFRFFDYRVALLAAIACLVAMLAINVIAGATAALIVFGLYLYLRHRAAPATWADGRRAYHMMLARHHLLLANAEGEHPRAWRPQLLVFSDSGRRRARILHFAKWVEAGGGLTTVVRMIESGDRRALERRQAEQEALAAEIAASKSSALPLVVVGTDTPQMVASIVQAAGVGPFRVNTVVVNWPEPRTAFYRPLGIDAFGQNVSLAFRLGCNLLLLDADAAEWESLGAVQSGERRIDVWWEDSSSGQLMLLLAYLMTRSDEWRGSRIRLLGPQEVVDSTGVHGKVLAERVEEIRIDAEVVTTPDYDESTVIETSRSSSVVFLPFRIHGGRFYSPFGWEIGPALERLPIVVLALAAEDVGLEADPDESVAPERKAGVD
jgi:amino acid transporter